MNKIKRTICPKCKGVNTLMYYAAAITGTYKCKKCEYIGSVILEEYVNLKENN